MSLEGPPAPQPASPQNLLETGLRSRPDDIAITSLARSLTWSQLNEASNTLAHNYRSLSLGLQRGLPNCITAAELG